jgi:hypothetical protein
MIKNVSYTRRQVRIIYETDKSYEMTSSFNAVTYCIKYTKTDNEVRKYVRVCNHYSSIFELGSLGNPCVFNSVCAAATMTTTTIVSNEL